MSVLCIPNKVSAARLTGAITNNATAIKNYAAASISFGRLFAFPPFILHRTLARLGFGNRGVNRHPSRVLHCPSFF